MGNELRLDGEFLKELGLDVLPDEQKLPFLEYVSEELELRVGTRLTEGMPDEMLDEFSWFVDMDMPMMKKWLAENDPEYKKSKAYAKTKLGLGDEGKDAALLLSEYGAMSWLRKNRPDFQKVVMATFDELKEEIALNRDAILG